MAEASIQTPVSSTERSLPSVADALTPRAVFCAILIGSAVCFTKYVPRPSGWDCERNANADRVVGVGLRSVSKYPTLLSQAVNSSGDNSHRGCRRSPWAGTFHIRIHWIHSSVGVSHYASSKQTTDVQHIPTSVMVYSYVRFRNRCCCPFQTIVHPPRASSLSFGHSYRYFDRYPVWGRRDCRTSTTTCSSCPRVTLY